MHGEDGWGERRQRLHGLFDRVGNVVKLEIEENRKLVLGDPEHAFMAVGTEELEAELHSAGNAENGAGQRRGPVNVGRIDCDEDRLHAAGSPSSAGSGSGEATDPACCRSKTSIRRRAFHMRARWISQVGSQPSRNATSSRTGSLMSA